MVSLGMIAMLGVGMLAGSLLTPALRAEKAQTVDMTTTVPTYPPGVGTTASPYSGGYGNAYVPYPPPRWQIFILPGLGTTREPLMVLLDSASGESFMLQYGGDRYYWTHLGR
jgi:hypothetical protein